MALVLLLSCATPMAQEEGKMALRGGTFHYYTDEELKELKNSGAVVETNGSSKAGPVGEVPYIVLKDEEESTTESESESKPATPEEETSESATAPAVSSMSAESSASEGPPSIGYRDHEDWDWENDPARGSNDVDSTSRTGAAQTTSFIRGNHHTMLRRR